jgi:6-phosphofructokinase 1
LGHIQRGGSPTANDRILASRIGVAAVDALLDEQRSIMIGIVNNEIVHVPFNKAIKDEKPVDKYMFDVLRLLSI